MVELALPALDLVAGAALSERDRIFCFTSSVVKGAPVVRMADEEAVEDSLEEPESELADLAVFLYPASEDLLAADGAVFAAAGVFLWVCWGEATDSSVSSVLETAWRKQVR